MFGVRVISVIFPENAYELSEVLFRTLKGVIVRMFRRYPQDSCQDYKGRLECGVTIINP